MKYSIGLGVLALAAAGTAFAQGFPAKPVTFVVTFAAGGATDIVARQMAGAAAARLGQNVLVENRVGAGGAVGAASVARAAPDGYTLMFATGSALAVAPALNRNVGYDGLASFAPVIEFARGPFILSAAGALPAKNLKELAAWGKANPGRLNCGSAGTGSVHHVACELLNRALGIEAMHIPFKGSAPGFTALVAGDIQLLFDAPPTPLPFIRSGKVRPLGVTGERRLPALADVPTFAEQGVSGVEVSFWWGLVAPAGTPRPVIERLNADFGAALRDPAVREVFARQDIELTPGTPEQFGALLKTEIPRWAGFIQRTGVKAD